jgi:2-succinyl-6-hydroxy-2,4-cyclohexadiene-1-carboxylate synthase
MILENVNGLSINVEIAGDGDICLLFIHGFAGAAEDWAEIVDALSDNFKLVSIDMPGFGKSAKPEEPEYYTQAFGRTVITSIIKQLGLNQVVLVGYSMGGRFALDVVASDSQSVIGLILESSAPGIEDEEQRELRVSSDTALANAIAEKGMEWFVNYWSGIDLFQSQKELSELKMLQQNHRRLKNSTIALTNSLKSFGAGVMEPLWNYLHTIDVPVLLMSGELDTKFTAINSRMSVMLPLCKHIVVKNTGHNIHLENPSEFVNLLKDFITEFVQPDRVEPWQ